jgi:phage tail tape-measure protein
MSKKEAYREKMEAQLEILNAKFEELQAKAKYATAEAKIEYHKQIEALQPKMKEFKKKLQELQVTGEEAWEKFKTGLENVFEETRDALEKALSKFRPEK